jgi:hypothetical protein
MTQALYAHMNKKKKRMECNTKVAGGVDLEETS